MTWADQQILNKFASENNRRHALKAEIAALKEQITALSDAKDEVELAIEDEARLKVGEVYMVMSQDEVVSSIESQIEKLENTQSNVQNELDKIITNIAAYKRELYGKFGTDNINLEDE
jgi:chaperonin cofactor prefoldin